MNKSSAATRDGVIALLLVIVAGAVYIPSLSADFINLDDFQYVIDNPYVLYPSWSKVVAVFAEITHPATVGGYYQPLTMVSLMLDRLLTGSGSTTHAAVFHFTNLLLHAANSGLLFLLLRRWGAGTLPAAVAAALFALHPMNVESVVWVSQRKSLLATFFALGLFLAYDRYIRTRQIKWLAVAAASLILSLLSKPTGWLLPLVLLLLDVWPYRRFSAAAVWEKVPLLALIVPFAWIPFVSQRESSGMVDVTIVNDPLGTLLVLCHNVVFYLRKLVWPVTLSPQYPMPAPDDLRPTALPFAAGLMGTALLALLLATQRKRPAIWVPFVAFIVLLGPVLGAVQFMGAIAADRFVYLPMIPLLFALAMLIQLGLSRRGVVALATAACCAVALLFCSSKTWAQQTVWTNSMTYWREVVRQYPNEAGAHEGLGSAYLVDDNFDAAEPEFRTAIALRSTFTRAYFRLAELMLYRNNPAAALDWAQRGLAIPNADREGWFFLGLAHSRLGQYDKAVMPYRRALDARPTWRDALFNLGNALMRTDTADKAVPWFEKLVDLEPDNPDYLYMYAISLTESGHDGAAYDVLKRALLLRPSDPNALYAISACAANMKRTSAAWRTLQIAVALQPALIHRAETEWRFENMRKDERWKRLCDAARIAETNAAASQPASRPDAAPIIASPRPAP